MGNHDTMTTSDSFGITRIKGDEIEKELKHAMIDYETWTELFKHFKLQGEREFLVLLIGRMVENKERKAHDAHGFLEGLMGRIK